MCTKREDNSQDTLLNINRASNVVETFKVKATPIPFPNSHVFDLRFFVNNVIGFIVNPMAKDLFSFVLRGGQYGYMNQK